ncbi:hypothetical protein [Halomicronema sp. CCY15110]|uniref:hypothetical protein n=1 Tax=Halomicronema sp. CCY15110 TaxID=2767773 RepID=UPI00194FFE0D|nr:hypothetical protein [Halomicronema sp. CCY15110]
MAINNNELEAKVNAILQSLDSTSQFYGKLLNWQGADSFWHYGIGLSDTHIFDTGRGWQPFERHYVDAKFVLGIDDITYPPDKTIKRLIHALRCFKNWEYGLLGWNCEHLGRLAATNQPMSYEVKRQPWPIPQLNHDGWHPTAERDLRDYLLRHAPELV